MVKSTLSLFSFYMNIKVSSWFYSGITISLPRILRNLVQCHPRFGEHSSGSTDNTSINLTSWEGQSNDLDLLQVRSYQLSQTASINHEMPAWRRSIKLSKQRKFYLHANVKGFILQSDIFRDFLSHFCANKQEIGSVNCRNFSSFFLFPYKQIENQKNEKKTLTNYYQFLDHPIVSDVSPMKRSFFAWTCIDGPIINVQHNN